MCKFDKMIDDSSLASIIVSLFRASLLFVALLSTNFYAHFSNFNLPIFSVFTVSSFLFLNIMFVCNKMSTYEKKKPENENKVLVHKSQVADFQIDGVFECDSFIFDGKSDEKGHTSDSISSSSTLYISKEAILEDTEEDYLIEIIPLEKKLDLKECVLQEQGVEDFFEDISGEDNLIEIDISMGSITISGSGSGSKCKVTA